MLSSMTSGPTGWWSSVTSTRPWPPHSSPRSRRPSLGCRLAHVEAGLRSGDWRMPEEVNRVVTDQLADLLLTHSPEAASHLAAEGIPPRRIVFVGNVMIDSLRGALGRSSGEAARSRHGLDAPRLRAGDVAPAVQRRFDRTTDGPARRPRNRVPGAAVALAGAPAGPHPAGAIAAPCGPAACGTGRVSRYGPAARWPVPS